MHALGNYAQLLRPPPLVEIRALRLCLRDPRLRFGELALLELPLDREQRRACLNRATPRRRKLDQPPGLRRTHIGVVGFEIALVAGRRWVGAGREGKHRNPPDAADRHGHARVVRMTEG